MNPNNQGQGGYYPQSPGGQHGGQQHYGGYGSPNPTAHPQYQQQQHPHHQQQPFQGQQRPAYGTPGSHPSSSRPPQPSGHAPVWKPNAFEAKQLDSWFYHIDEDRIGVIKGAQAVTFLKKSNLHREILRKIWSLVDTQNRGFIDKNQFFVIMRLVSICHNIPDMSDLSMETYYRTVYADFNMPPMVESEIPPSTPKNNLSPATASPRSSLPGIQNSCPSPSQPLSSHHQQPGQQAPLPHYPSGHIPTQHPSTGHGVCSGMNPPLPPAEAYATTEEEFVKYLNLFRTYDKDADGYLSGSETFPIFMKSGIDQQILRAIWHLVDQDSDHRINAAEFGVAFHLILCVSKKRLPVPPCLPAPLVSVLAKHTLVPQTQHSFTNSTNLGQHQSPSDFDDEFDDFQGPSTLSTTTSTPLTPSSMPMSSNMSSGSLGSMGSMNSAPLPIDNMMPSHNITGQPTSDDFEFDDFQEAVIESTALPNMHSTPNQTHVSSVEISAVWNKSENFESQPTLSQQFPQHLQEQPHHQEEVILTNNSMQSHLLTPTVPKRETKSIADLLSSVSDDPLNLKGSQLYADPAQLQAAEEKRQKEVTPAATAVPTWMTPPELSAPSSERMSAFDDLAEMDLQASNEEWDDFADDKTAPVTQDVDNVHADVVVNEFGELSSTKPSGKNETGVSGPVSDTMNDHFVDFNTEFTNPDEFGDFAGDDNHTETFGDFSTGADVGFRENLANKNNSSDEFGDFGADSTNFEDDFGDFSVGDDAKTDEFGDFNDGDKDDGDQKADDFVEHRDEIGTANDFGDFSVRDEFSTGDVSVNHFGDFPSTSDDILATKNDDEDDFGDFSTTDDKKGDFGEFSTTSVEKSDSFGDFPSTVGDKDEDFGDFPSTATVDKTASFEDFPRTVDEDFGDFPPITVNDDTQDDFGDFSSTTENHNITDEPHRSGDFSEEDVVPTEDEFGHFPEDEKKNDGILDKSDENISEPKGSISFSDEVDTRMGNATLDFSLDDMDDPFADIGARISAPTLEFSLLDMDMPSSTATSTQEVFDLNSLLISQSTPAAPSITSLLSTPTAASSTDNVDDSLLLLDFPALPTTSSFSSLPDPVNRNLNFDELEHLATVLAELNCFVEAYGALCQAQSVKRIRELSVQKMDAVENDDLELAIQLRDAINQEREEGVTATRSDEKAWLNTAAAGIDKIKSGETVPEAVSIDKLVEAVCKLDPNCGKQAKMKFLALRPSPDQVDRREFLQFSVTSKRSLQLAIAVRSTHKQYVKHWQLLLNKTTSLLSEGINSLEQFKEMPPGMQRTVMEEASTDGGKFNTFVRGILHLAEVGSWVAASCLEGMVETASATKTLSLCEIVVRLASSLRKMPNVVIPIVSLEELTTRSDRQLSREGVTFCNITLRPVVVGVSPSASTSKKSACSSGAIILYKNVPYLQGAVSLWVNQIKSDAPHCDGVSPFA